jgi:UDP-glucose 4-epimerase
MRVLITGGAGFIGLNIVEKYQSLGHDVTVLDNLSNSHFSHKLNSAVVLHVGDVLDEKLLSQLVKSTDLVIHLAALGSVPRSLENPNKTFEVNVNGFNNILNSIREFRKPLIWSSSSSVLGSLGSQGIEENDQLLPISPYAASKACCELLARAYAKSFELNITTIRLFNVFGPYQSYKAEYAAVVPIFIQKALKGASLSIFGDGKSVRDYTYVKDVAEIVYKLAESKRNLIHPLNIGFNRPIKTLELAEKIIKITSSKSKIDFLPVRRGDVEVSVNKSPHLRSFLPDSYSTPIDTALKSTIAFNQALLGSK